MKENKYVRDKKDNLIYLNEGGKLQDVSNMDLVFLFPFIWILLFFFLARLATRVCLSRFPSEEFF